MHAQSTDARNMFKYVTLQKTLWEHYSAQKQPTQDIKLKTSWKRKMLREEQTQINDNRWTEGGSEHCMTS